MDASSINPIACIPATAASNSGPAKGFVGAVVGTAEVEVEEGVAEVEEVVAEEEVEEDDVETVGAGAGAGTGTGAGAGAGYKGMYRIQRDNKEVRYRNNSFGDGKRKDFRCLVISLTNALGIHNTSAIYRSDILPVLLITLIQKVIYLLWKPISYKQRNHLHLLFWPRHPPKLDHP
jgi:hypothetical protein